MQNIGSLLWTTKLDRKVLFIIIYLPKDLKLDLYLFSEKYFSLEYQNETYAGYLKK